MNIMHNKTVKFITQLLILEIFLLTNGVT